MTEDILTLSDDLIVKLKQQPLFRNLSHEDIKNHITRFKEIHMLTGELAFRKGERYHKGIYFLLNGNINLCRSGSDITLSCSSCSVGLSTFLGKTMYTMNAVAQSDCVMLFVHELCIYRLMEYSGDFRSKLIKDIQDRLTRLGNATSAFLMQSPYSTVGGCMSSPVITMQKGKSVMEAANLMKEHHINSLLIINRKHIIKGLLTSAHLTSRFMTNLTENIKQQEVEKYMDTEPITFPPEYPVVEALSEMQLAGATHAVVMKNSKPAGILSAYGVSRMLFENANLYCAHIDNMTSFDELKNIFSQIYKAANTIATSSRISREELTAISAVHRSIQRKAFQLTSDYFKSEKNFKLNDYFYCCLLLGSGARREMDLSPYINNAFIIQDDVSKDVEKSFREFAEKYRKNLENIGYRPCRDNDVKSLNIELKYSEWIAEIDIWASKDADGKYKYSFSMLMDMAALEGDINLAWSIRDYMLKKVADKPSIVGKLTQSYPQVKIPVSQFGSFITEKEGPNADMFNLKTQALTYMVNTTRLLSIYAGIKDIGTIDRIEHLARKNIITDELAKQAVIAFDTITETLINEQINQCMNNERITGYINPSSISLFYQEKLKRALQFATIYTSYGINLLNEA